MHLCDDKQHENKFSLLFKQHQGCIQLENAPPNFLRKLPNTADKKKLNELEKEENQHPKSA